MPAIALNFHPWPQKAGVRYRPTTSRRPGPAWRGQNPRARADRSLPLVPARRGADTRGPTVRQIPERSNHESSLPNQGKSAHRHTLPLGESGGDPRTCGRPGIVVAREQAWIIRPQIRQLGTTRSPSPIPRRFGLLFNFPAETRQIQKNRRQMLLLPHNAVRIAGPPPEQFSERRAAPLVQPPIPPAPGGPVAG